jgi:DUF1365 family protein
MPARSSTSRPSAGSKAYRFRFERHAGDAQHPPHTLVLDLDDAQGPLLQTSVGGRLEALSPAVRRACFGTPLMTLGVIARIHWQALQLWRKRVPFFGKPAAPEHFVTR